MNDTELFEQEVLISNMKKLKEERKLTYEQIGQATNLDKSAVYKLFHKINTPTINFLIGFSRFLQIPLYELFIPSEEMLRSYYANTIMKRLERFNLTVDELAVRLNTHLLRVNDICNARATPNKEELSAIFNLLGIEWKDVYTFENNMRFLDNILTDFGLSQNHKENIIEYIQTIKK